MPELTDRKNLLQLQFYTDVRVMAGIVNGFVDKGMYEPGIRQSEFLRTLLDRIHDTIATRTFESSIDAEDFLSSIGLIQFKGRSSRFKQRLNKMATEEITGELVPNAEPPSQSIMDMLNGVPSTNTDTEG